MSAANNLTRPRARHAGAAFDFGAYMRQSMEEDYAHLVGLGLGMWLFLIAFVLLSTVMGLSAAPSLVFAQYLTRRPTRAQHFAGKARRRLSKSAFPFIFTPFCCRVFGVRGYTCFGLQVPLANDLLKIYLWLQWPFPQGTYIAGDALAQASSTDVAASTRG